MQVQGVDLGLADNVPCFLLLDFSPPQDRLTLGLLGSLGSGVTGLGLYEENFPTSASLTPLLTPQAYFSLNGKNSEDGGEENIVYL